MDSTTPEEEDAVLSLEEMYQANIMELRERWAGNALVLRDLAKAWSMGVVHAQRMDNVADSRSFLNPFW